MVIRKDSEEDGSPQAPELSKPLILTSLSASFNKKIALQNGRMTWIFIEPSLWTCKINCLVTFQIEGCNLETIPDLSIRAQPPICWIITMHKTDAS